MEVPETYGVVVVMVVSVANEDTIGEIFGHGGEIVGHNGGGRIKMVAVMHGGCCGWQVAICNVLKEYKIIILIINFNY
ncbi:hypothetical protein Ancab_014937 [Ancistrocladus abbreviatus]